MSKIDRLRDITDSELQNIIDCCSSKSEILNRLSINSRDNRCRRILSERMNALGCDRPYGPKGTRTWTIEALKEAVINSLCWSDVCKLLDLTTHGTNINLLRDTAIRHNIDATHFDRGLANKKAQGITVRDELSLLCKGLTTNRSKIRRMVIKHKLLPMVCVECGIGDEWNGKPITLQLDHINGDCYDHRIENLRFMCPNCHSQTPTFQKKNNRS